MKTAGQTLLAQSADIALAIEKLQEKLDEMTSFSLDEATWRSVSKFAQAADVARDVTARLKEHTP